MAASVSEDAAKKGPEAFYRMTGGGIALARAGEWCSAPAESNICDVDDVPECVCLCVADFPD